MPRTNFWSDRNVQFLEGGIEIVSAHYFITGVASYTNVGNGTSGTCISKENYVYIRVYTSECWTEY